MAILIVELISFNFPMTGTKIPDGPRVVLIGNPVDGFEVVGPFADFEAAVKFIETEPRGDSKRVGDDPVFTPLRSADASGSVPVALDRVRQVRNVWPQPIDATR